MKYVHALLVTLCIWGILTVPDCSSQTHDKSLSYPACEPRSNTDPGRLNIRANAEGFGMITPCRGGLELYINPNSQVRSMVFDLEYLDMDDDPVLYEKIRAVLEASSTGMFQKEVYLKSIEQKSCRNIQIIVRSMSCFSADGSQADCPEIRIIPPDVFHSIMVKDDSLKICSAGS